MDVWHGAGSANVLWLLPPLAQTLYCCNCLLLMECKALIFGQDGPEFAFGMIRL